VNRRASSIEKTPRASRSIAISTTSERVDTDSAVDV
jgi:hypothetical protein